MENTDDERISAYLRNEMTPRQRADFERDLEADASLRHDFELTSRITAALAERARMKQLISTWNSQRQRRTRPRRLALWLGAVACIAVIIVAAMPLFFTPDVDAPDIDCAAVCRGGDEGLARVDALMESADFHAASLAADSLARVYSAALRPGTDSLSPRELYEQQRLRLSLHEINWRRINILRALGRRQEAIALLEQLRREEGPYSDRARELYIDLTEK